MDMPLNHVLDYNADLLRDEVTEYQQLQALYQSHLIPPQQQPHHGDTLVPTDSQGQDTAPLTTNIAASIPSSKETCAATATAVSSTIIDPLTAMMMEQQAQETRRQELDLRYRKEKARRNRGLLSEPGASNKAILGEDVDAEGAGDTTKKKIDRETVRTNLRTPT
jgi:hypothetical protein